MLGALLTFFLVGLVSLVVISILGLIISRYTVTPLERRTVQRWGMVDDKRNAGANIHRDAAPECLTRGQRG